MKLLLLADAKITDRELASFQTEFNSLLTSVSLTPSFTIQREDFSNVPTYTDSDGDTMPTKPYVTGVINKVHSTYDTYGVDHIYMLVHRDHWKYKGIWGTNWSNIYRDYHVHFCRFDTRNVANSLGTAYHEWMHSLDALILTHTGVEIDNHLKHTPCFVDWDSTVVHGNRFRGCAETPYKYIKWKDNLDALRTIVPDLKRAYAVRRDLDGKMGTIKMLQVKLIGLLQTKLKKYGVPRGT